MKRLALLVLSALLATASCSHELEGPGEPTVKDGDLTYCGADSQSFVITGEHLSPMVREGATDDAEIDMPEVCLTRVADADGNPVSGEPTICIPDEDVEWVSQNEIRFTTRSDLGLTSGTYDVTVTNPDGSKASGGTVTMRVISEGLLLFWADPNVVFNGISTRVTLYGVNLGIVDSVSLVDCDSGTDVELLDPELTGTRSNRMQATIPADTAPGTCDVVVKSDNGCEARLVDGMRITDVINDQLLTSIDPEYGWTDSPTPVTITGSGFGQVPRAYLNPANPDQNTVASALTSVAWVSESRLTGIVPRGLPVGSYDVIVVDPDGDVGRLPAAFSITAEPPPVIDSVTPSYLRNLNTPQTLTIEGENLNPGEVTLSCRQPAGGEVGVTGSVQAGGTSTSLDVSVTLNNLDDGAVCLVRVTNGDQSYFDYSAIAIANSSLNLNAFSAGPPMNTARRAPAVIAARATRSQRFLYAIGGDNDTGVLRSVETSSVDIYGEPNPWFDQEVVLPEPRTLAGVARVGRFLYLVGGNDGAAPTNKVLRAQVLDPLVAPEIVDVAARRGDDGEGIGSGVWYYRVSAVMADDDDANPGGETLASDPLVVNLAQQLDGTLVLTLIWEPVPGAKGYNIYRSATGDLAVGDVRLIANVEGGDTTLYEDVNPQDPNLASKHPLPLGSTGVWKELVDNPLGTAREALGVAAAPDPANPDLWHLYAIAGRDGGALASWERLSITIEAQDAQTLAGWTAGGNDISSTRSELTAYTVTHVEAAQVNPGVAYVYAGGGVGSNNIDIAQVAAGGDLTWTLAGQTMNPNLSGYAGVAGGGKLFSFGGGQGGPTTGNNGGEIDPSAPPALVNWQSESVKLAVPRHLAGGTVESAFIFVVGGETTGGVATPTMERTVL